MLETYFVPQSHGDFTWLKAQNGIVTFACGTHVHTCSDACYVLYTALRAQGFNHETTLSFFEPDEIQETRVTA